MIIISKQNPKAGKHSYYSIIPYQKDASVSVKILI